MFSPFIGRYGDMESLPAILWLTLSKAQHLPSNLYPYPNHNHRQRPMSTHSMTCAHPCPPITWHVLTHAHPCPPMNNNIAPMPTQNPWVWVWAPNVGLWPLVKGPMVWSYMLYNNLKLYLAYFVYNKILNKVICDNDNRIYMWFVFESNTLPTLVGAGHQWTESTSTGCNHWLSLAKIILKVSLAGRNRSLVAHAIMCGGV
jgi:hypothetical protein